MLQTDLSINLSVCNIRLFLIRYDVVSQCPTHLAAHVDGPTTLMLDSFHISYTKLTFHCLPASLYTLEHRGLVNYCEKCTLAPESAGDAVGVFKHRG